jgi:DNA-binding transcriptional LysR family regulator
MKLHQIRYFLALSRSLNFTRAADDCHVTQPALTKAIQKLESELGGPLIHRERQLTQLTDLGKLILPLVERMATAEETLVFHATEFRSKEIAPLKIALAPCISANLVAALLAEIAMVVPGLRAELSEASPESIPELLMKGEVSAAIAGDVDGIPDRINHWCLFEERFIVLAAEDSPFAVTGEVSIEMLATATWLERIGCPVWRTFLSKNFPESHEPTVAHSSGNESHLQHMVAAGMGIMLTAEHAPRLPSLVPCRIENDPLKRDIMLLVVAGRRYSPALEALVKATRLRDWQVDFTPHRKRDPTIEHSSVPSDNSRKTAS